jgi:hypothetical protein
MDEDLKAKLFGATQVKEAGMSSIELFVRIFLETYLRDGHGVMSKKETCQIGESDQGHFYYFCFSFRHQVKGREYHVGGASP